MSIKCKISLDASEYRAELNKVVSETKSSRAKLESKTSFPDKKVGTITAPSTSMWSKFTAGIKDCWKEMTNLEGGAKKAVTSMVAGGGLIGVAYAAVQSVIKICTALYDNFIQKGKEAAQAHVDNANSVAEAASNTDKLKSSASEAVNQLSQLANVEKMSNAQTAQAVSLVAELTKQYGDLGVSVDETTGRIKGLGSAIVKKQEKDAQREIEALKAQIKSLQNANAQEDKNVSSAGWRIPFTDIQIGGEQDAKDAASRKVQNTKQIMDAQIKLREAQKRKAELAKNQLLKTQSENAALEQQQRDRMDQQTYRNADNELNRTKDPIEKIANRQRLISGEQKRNDELRKKTEAAKAQMDQLNPGTQGYEDAKKAYLQNAAEQAKSDEKIAQWNEQIKQIKYEQAEAIKKITDQGAHELQYNQLIIDGEYEKAAALKLEKELKDQNLKLTEEEKQKVLDQRKALEKQGTQKMIADAKDEVALNQLLIDGQYDLYEAEKLRLEMKRQGKQLTQQETEEILKQRKALASQKLQGNLQDQLKALQYKAMDAAGQGKEAARLKALDDAEKAKGFALTASEKDAVNKLTELQQKLSDVSSAKSDTGGGKILTNDLTRRGGFAGGAVMPSAQDQTRSINEKMSAVKDILTEIKRIQDGLQSTISTGLKT